MRLRRALLLAVAILVPVLLPLPVQSAAPPIPRGIVLVEVPKDPGQVKIVLVAGSSVYKPGEHEYIAGSAALMDLLRQTPGVFPVLAVDWPKKPTTLAGARSFFLFFDPADKHALLKKDVLA